MIQTNRPSGIFVCSWYKSINLNEVKIKYFYTPLFFLLFNHSFHFSGNYD